MNALWMIGLLIFIAGASGFMLMVCRVAALADRDMVYPEPGENPHQAQLQEWSEYLDPTSMCSEEQTSSICLEQISASS